MIKTFFNVCWAECLKLRRSKAPLLSAVAYAMLPPAAALLMLVADDPLRVRAYRFMTLQSQITLMQADWPRYFAWLSAGSALAGLAVFSLFMIWIFGREHADRTSKELLTLPIPREMLVGAKVLVAGLWCLLLQCGMLLAAVLLGACLRLPSWSPELLQSSLASAFEVAGLSFCLAVPFGLVANLSRGTMAAVGTLFLAFFFTIIMIATGWGAFFPWAVPTLLSGAAGNEASQLGCVSYSLVFLTALAGLLGNMAWWRWADQV